MSPPFGVVAAGLRRLQTYQQDRIVATAFSKFKHLRCANAIKRLPPERGRIRSMSVSTDTFARFVNLLADTLDDHQAAGDALAARLHMSRFHFDRLVSAAGGEPPGALRRRVLLERAAYQLITSDREVLEIAMDAGDSSIE